MSKPAKDDFILELNQLMLEEAKPERKLFFQMIKESGVRWAEIMMEGKDDAPDLDKEAEFIAEFMVATGDFMSWLGVVSIQANIGGKSREQAIAYLMKTVEAGIRRNIDRKSAANFSMTR
jgi:hypothetical protein